MAGVCLCFLLLFQLAAFGTLAPTENDRTHVKKTPPNDDSVLKSPLDSSALIKPSESMQPQSGAASLDFSQKSDPKETENLPPATESSQLHISVSNSDAQKPNLNEVKQGEDLSAKSQSLHSVPESSSLKLEAKETENVLSSIEKNQTDGVVPEFSPQKSDHNEASQNENLPSKSKTLQSDTSVAFFPPQQSEHNGANHNGNLLAKSKSPHSDADESKSLHSDAESPPRKSDQDEANKNENLQIKSQVLQSNASIADSSHRNSDHNEANQNEKLATKSKTIQSDTSVAVLPPQKSEHNGANPNENLAAKFKTPDSGAAILESSLQKSKHNEANQNENLPSAAENNPADIFVPKDDDMDGDNIADDDEDGKVGEKVGGASQSEKDDAKNSPSDPVPKNGSENSHFFAYLVTTAIVVAALYIAYHNKRKIIAFALEGKKSKVIRRPKSSDYQRLDQKI